MERINTVQIEMLWDNRRCGGIIMTKKEFDEAMKNIEEEMKQKRKKIMLHYAIANEEPKVNIGDIIENCQGRIEVEKKILYTAYTEPQFGYCGKKMTKYNKHFKNGEVISCFDNIKIIRRAEDR